MATTVLLSVGGKLFTTTDATLTSPFARGSMLETLAGLHRSQETLAGLHRSQGRTPMQATHSDPRHSGAMFIDRDGVNFSYILNYLRDGHEMVLPADVHTTQLVLREAHYYQLKGLIQLLEVQATRLKQRVAEEDKKRGELQSVVDVMSRHVTVISQQLGELHNYLTPTPLYARRQLLDDLGIGCGRR